MIDNVFCTWEEAVEWLIRQPDKQSLVQACYYDPPLLQAAERFRNSAEWAEIRQWVTGCSGTALDIGAGNGIASYALARDGWKTVAVEPDKSEKVGAGAIRRLAEETKLEITVFSDIAERLSFCDSIFDLVYARQVLHHARNLQILCSELFRVLKPGGMLIATREHVISSRTQLQSFLNNHPLHHFYGGENAFTRKEYLNALRSAGFIVYKTYGPFDTVVNYAPHTEETLRKEILKRIIWLPGVRHLLQGRLWKACLLLLSHLDNRPGRLYSFIATKP